MVCRNCGATISSSARVCIHCGASLESAPSKAPLVCAILSLALVIIPFVGPLAALVLGIVAFNLGNKAVAAANARPDRAGIGLALTGKWMGLGGLIQAAIMSFWYLMIVASF